MGWMNNWTRATQKCLLDNMLIQIIRSSLQNESALTTTCKGSMLGVIHLLQSQNIKDANFVAQSVCNFGSPSFCNFFVKLGRSESNLLSQSAGMIFPPGLTAPSLFSVPSNPLFPKFPIVAKDRILSSRTLNFHYCRGQIDLPIWASDSTNSSKLSTVIKQKLSNFVASYILNTYFDCSVMPNLLQISFTSWCNCGGIITCVGFLSLGFNGDLQADTSIMDGIIRSFFPSCVEMLWGGMPVLCWMSVLCWRSA